jgi:hypothetical protein
LDEVQKMMTAPQSQGINQLGAMRGDGVYNHGLDADGKVVGYVLFNPLAGTPLQDYYVLGVFFSPDKDTEAEFEQVVNSIRVVGTPANGPSSRR